MADIIPSFNSFSGEAAQATSAGPVETAIDYGFTSDLFINLQFMIRGAVWGDHLRLEIVDKDGIENDPETLLAVLYQKWAVNADTASQGMIAFSQFVPVTQGMYLRVKYTATGDQHPVTVSCNIQAYLRI